MRWGKNLPARNIYHSPPSGGELERRGEDGDEHHLVLLGLQVEAREAPAACMNRRREKKVQIGK